MNVFNFFSLRSSSPRRKRSGSGAVRRFSEKDLALADYFRDLRDGKTEKVARERAIAKRGIDPWDYVYLE